MHNILLLLTLFFTSTFVSSAPEHGNSNKIESKFQPDSDRAFYAKFHFDDETKHCTILKLDWIRKYRGFKHDVSPSAIVSIEKAAVQPPADAATKSCDRENSKIFEIFGRREDLVRAHIDLHCGSIETTGMGRMFRDEPEIRKIVDSGDQTNRIDVTFMGDGYTLEERDKFFDDMTRITKDMFEGVTFKSYLPLFNIWAIFVPSNESGIGYDGPKNTPFKLYREKGQLRVIYTGNPTYAREVCDLTGPMGCDFPSLIANDDYYGGVGGEFVISTRSNRTGTYVLRHEMGHSFINVGDEYDNSPTYYGYNSADTVDSLGWNHWLSGPKREERGVYRILAYPWRDLSTGEEVIQFTSDGLYSRWYLWASVSAAGEEDSLEFLLDGEVLPWKTTGTDDRQFYSWTGDSGFSNGNHTLIVRSKTESTNPDIPRMICSVNLHEFGSEEEFHISNDYISAYPVWDESGVKRFRPTNLGCLMRDVTINNLCSVCKEGMWYEFLKKISLIDNVTITISPQDPALRLVDLTTLKLGQLRPPENQIEGETLTVKWFNENIEIEEFRDQFSISVNTSQQQQNWRVDVQLTTPEVRVDPQNLLKDSTNFII